jgi:Flp pilus assembly protein TadD
MGLGTAGRNFLLAALVLSSASVRARADTPPVPARLPEPYAVMLLDNQSGVRSLDWLRAAIPFLIGERLEAHRKLRPSYGPLVVPSGPGPGTAAPAAIAAVAGSVGASLVLAGWFDRADDWELVLHLRLWRAIGGDASVVADAEAKATFKDLFATASELVRQLCEAANVSIVSDDRERIERIPTEDFYAFTLFGRGLLVLAATGDDEAAEANLNRAVFIDPEFAEAHRLLGEIYASRGRLARAKGKFGHALDVRPDYYAALAGDARVALAAGQPAEARDRFATMLTRRPWDLALRLQLGKLLWETGELGEARVELGRVVARQPDNIEARRTLVLVHAARGEGRDLVAQLEALAKAAPGDLEVQLDLGAAYLSVGRDDDAIRIYEAVVRAHPDHLQALKLLGDLHQSRGDDDGAIGFYRRALQAHPRDPRAYFLLGQAYVATGNDRAAKQIFRRALQFKPYRPQIYNNLGTITYRQGHFGEARWYLTRAVEKRPQSARFRYNFALVLAALRELEDALNQIDVGLALDSRHVGLQYLRGVVALRLGDADGAYRAFERTLELAPDHADARHNLELLDQMRQRALEGEIRTELPPPAN